MLEIPQFDNDDEDHCEQVDWINATVQKLNRRTNELRRAENGLAAYEAAMARTETTMAMRRDLTHKIGGHTSDVLKMVKYILTDSPFADPTILNLVQSLMSNLPK